MRNKHNIHIKYENPHVYCTKVKPSKLILTVNLGQSFMFCYEKKQHEKENIVKFAKSQAFV